MLIVLILFEKLGDGGGVERRLVGEVLGAGRAADGRRVVGRRRLLAALGRSV